MLRLRTLCRLAVLSLISGLPAAAAPGDPDLTFGTDGKTVTDLGRPYDLGRAVEVQPDGKIVLAGWSAEGSIANFAVVRYLPDGSLDPSFGSGGKVVTASATPDFAHALALQADGKIVLAGGSVSSMVVARYNTDGSADTGFGGTGRVAVTGGLVVAYGVAVQGDGKIVAAGTGLGSGGVNLDFAMVRLLADGTLDSGFGTGGVVTTELGTTDDEANSVALQADGKIVLGGRTGNGAASGDLAVVRYLSDGTLDPAFGTGGKVMGAAHASGTYGRRLAIQPDGKIVQACTNPDYSTGGAGYTVVRYNSDGSLDTAFNGTGKVSGPAGKIADVEGLRLDADGNILIAGLLPRGGTSLSSVLRYRPDGMPDASFSGSFPIYVLAIALQADGRAVLGGQGAAIVGATSTSPWRGWEAGRCRMRC